MFDNAENCLDMLSFAPTTTVPMMDFSFNIENDFMAHPDISLNGSHIGVVTAAREDGARRNSPPSRGHGHSATSGTRRKTSYQNRNGSSPDKVSKRQRGGQPTKRMTRSSANRC